MKDSKRLFTKHIVRKIFLEDWALKLVALVITFGLWFGVTGLSTPTTRRFTVPLNITGSNNTEFTSPQTEVEIVISGDKRRLDQINKADLAAAIDLTDAPAGDRVASLMPDTVAVNLPQGIKLVEVLPIRIPVKIETIVEKDVAVRAKTTGTPANGFEVYSISAMPQKIRVRGPAKLIGTLEFVETDIIDLTGRREGFTARQIPVSAADPQAAVQNTVADVDFRIGEKRIERSFTIPVTASPGHTATFTIYGPRSVLQKARSEMFRIETSDNGAEPQVILPDDLRDVIEIKNLKIIP